MRAHAHRGCPIYRVLVSRGTLILMTSSFWWHTSPLYAGFSKSAGISQGDTGIKGIFFPLEGQFLLEHRRGKYSSSSMTVFIWTQSVRLIRPSPTVNTVFFNTRAYPCTASLSFNRLTVLTVVIHLSTQIPVNVAIAGRRGASVSRLISRPACDQEVIAEWLIHLVVFLSRVRAG